jgi:hypothetical protein
MERTDLVNEIGKLLRGNYRLRKELDEYRRFNDLPSFLKERKVIAGSGV